MSNCRCPFLDHQALVVMYCSSTMVLRNEGASRTFAGKAGTQFHGELFLFLANLCKGGFADDPLVFSPSDHRHASKATRVSGHQAFSCVILIVSKQKTCVCAGGVESVRWSTSKMEKRYSISGGSARPLPAGPAHEFVTYSIRTTRFCVIRCMKY